MTKKETAEQKLLKLIEGQAGAADAKPTQSVEVKAPQGQEVAEKMAQAVKSTGLPPLSIQNFFDSLLSLFKGKLSHGPSALSFGLREMNNILTFATLVIAIFLITNFFNDMRLASKKIMLSTEINLAKGSEAILSPVKQLQEYLDLIQKRNIFQPFEKKPEEQVASATPKVKQIEALTKDLKLVGISWLDSPASASAMIENTTTGFTQFLKVGEKINNVTIKAIYADSVILTYENEELKMRL